jgi:hypothetical protein
MEPTDLSNAQQLLFNPVWFALAFPLFWCSISYVISRMSGWGEMHARYGGPTATAPPARSLRSGHIGIARYKGVLNIAHDQVGLYLSVMVLIRVGHPPLFIPWSEVGNVTKKKVLWSDRVGFSVGHPVITTLDLPLAAVKGSVLDRA